MSKHNEIGNKGEQIAAAYLLNKGYIIAHKNWRSGHKEIDIIAVKDDILVIVEIKTRSGYSIIFPEETVTRKKQLSLKAAAQAFAGANAEYKHIRFDIISILMQGGLVKEIVHFEEAFY